MIMCEHIILYTKGSEKYFKDILCTSQQFACTLSFMYVCVCVHKSAHIDFCACVAFFILTPQLKYCQLRSVHMYTHAQLSWLRLFGMKMSMCVCDVNVCQPRDKHFLYSTLFACKSTLFYVYFYLNTFQLFISCSLFLYGRAC